MCTYADFVLRFKLAGNLGSATVNLGQQVKLG